jgi:hypothetical protein
MNESMGHAALPLSDCDQLPLRELQPGPKTNPPLHGVPSSSAQPSR